MLSKICRLIQGRNIIEAVQSQKMKKEDQISQGASTTSIKRNTIVALIQGAAHWIKVIVNEVHLSRKKWNQLMMTVVTKSAPKVVPSIVIPNVVLLVKAARIIKNESSRKEGRKLCKEVLMKQRDKLRKPKEMIAQCLSAGSTCLSTKKSFICSWRKQAWVRSETSEWFGTNAAANQKGKQQSITCLDLARKNYYI